MIALISLDPQEVLRVFHVEQEAAVRVDLPDGSQLSPVTLGWTDGTYAVWPVEPFEVPGGKERVGAASYQFGDGVVSEIYDVQDVPVIVPDRVSRRQFKLQLAIDGIKGDVEAWVATQDDLVQIAYAESGEFWRNEPNMQAGFAALEYSPERVDEFFLAASQL